MEMSYGKQIRDKCAFPYRSTTKVVMILLVSACLYYKEAHKT